MDSPPVDRNIPLTPEPGWRRPWPAPPLLQRSSAQDPVSESVLREIVKMPGKIAGHSFCSVNSDLAPARVARAFLSALSAAAERPLANFDVFFTARGSYELQRLENLRWMCRG